MVKTKEDIIALYDLGCAMMIFSLNVPDISTKDVILRNFLTKSVSQLKSINLLNCSDQVLDCYIIYRSMVDRLGHLYYLERTKSFQQFDDWSFCRQIDANNAALSDELFKERLETELFLPNQQDKERYTRIKASEIKWRRPNIKDEFKQRDLYFLYKFGYDYASTHVHPMANDGVIEYNRMLQNPPISIVKHF